MEQIEQCCAEENEYLVTEELELQDQPFRYGGLWHDYDLDVEEWAEIVPTMKICHVCGKEMKNSPASDGKPIRRQYPYMGTYTIRGGIMKGYGMFHVMCRECAYEYKRGVVEMDGEIYQQKDEVNEEKYKKVNGYKLLDQV